MKKKKNKILKYAIYCVVGLILIFGIFLFTQNNEEKVKIGYRNHIAYLPVFIAQEKGFYEEQGLKTNFQIFDSTNQMISALISNNIDVSIGGANLETVFTAESKSKGSMKIFSTAEFSEEILFSCVMVNQNSNINNISEIKNKKIATLPGTFAPYWTKETLKANKIDNFELIEIAPGLQLSALESNQVDVLFTVEPLCSFIVNRDVGKVIDKDPLRYFSEIFALSIVSKKLSNQNKEIIKEANRKAINFINNNPHEALNIMAEYTGYDKEMIKGMNHLIYNEEIDATELQNIVNSLYLEGILDRQIPVRTLI